MSATIEELHERMTAREFAQWRAFDRLQPIGDDRADVLVARAVAHLCAALGVKNVQPQRYMPTWHRPTPTRREPAVIMAKTRGILASIGVQT